MCSVGISVVFPGHCHCVPWELPLYSMSIAIVFMSIAIVFMGIAIVFHGCCLCIPWTSVLCYVGIGIVFHGHSHSVDIGVVFCGHRCCILWASLLCPVDVAVVFCGQRQKDTCYLADSVMTVCLAAIPFPLKISWFICGCLVLKRLTQSVLYLFLPLLLQNS